MLSNRLDRRYYSSRHRSPEMIFEIVQLNFHLLMAVVMVAAAAAVGLELKSEK